MIRFATETNKSEIRQMWKTCFNDSDKFINLYFEEKYRNENTMIYFVQNQPVASLQILPYFFTFCGVEIPVGYISGACTLPEYRNNGYMEKLIIKSFEVMQERKNPLCLLIPAENWLLIYYQKFGFETVSENGEKSMFLKNIIDNAKSDFENAYLRFDSIFRNKDFCIQKSKADFKTIVKDAVLNNDIPKDNASGMARLIDVKLLLNLFAAKYPNKSFIFELSDSLITDNNAIFRIEKGTCSRIKLPDLESIIKIDVNLLCRLLFGYNLEYIIDNEVVKYFEPQKAILNLMLE